MLAVLCAAAGCGRRDASGELSAEDAAGYLSSASAERAVFSNGKVILSGRAAPAASIRLATPAGQAVTAHADHEGAWSLDLPAPREPQIFGLSMTAGGRRTQAQGYLLVGPAQAAVLRPGAGAIRLDGRRLGIGAVDFDRRGSGMVSGHVNSDTAVALRLDGRYAGEGRSGPDGRFSLVLPELAAGPHRIEVSGDGFESAVQVEVSPAQPLADGPMHSQFSAGGLRADWLTPGGGVQTTVLPG